MKTIVERVCGQVKLAEFWARSFSLALTFWLRCPLHARFSHIHWFYSLNAHCTRICAWWSSFYVWGSASLALIDNVSVEFSNIWSAIPKIQAEHKCENPLLCDNLTGRKEFTTLSIHSLVIIYTRIWCLGILYHIKYLEWMPIWINASN